MRLSNQNVHAESERDTEEGRERRGNSHTYDPGRENATVKTQEKAVGAVTTTRKSVSTQGEWTGESAIVPDTTQKEYC